MISLNERWRVIDGEEPSPYGQWMLQRSSKRGWETQSWCQTRAVLQRCIREKIIHGAVFYPGSSVSMPVGDAELQKVASLPPQHPHSGLRPGG